ncbi:MAG: ATP-binding protein [Actinoallomurus sp.]
MCDKNAGAANSYLLHLGAHPRAPKTARTALRTKLRDWNLSHLIDDAELVTAELATNAMKRGLPFTLELSKGDTSVLIEVTDTSDGTPVVIDNTGNATAEEGRGIYLVDLLSKEWGVRPTGKGKTVWARVGT